VAGRIFHEIRRTRSYTWTGSENDIIPEMVNAFKVAITSNVDGIAVAVVDPKAFNAVTDEALGKGIPVVAYNAQAPDGSGSHVMSYIGQDLYQAGVAVARRILTYVKKGDLVGGMISVPGSLNEQPRMDGAASVFKPADIDFVQVGVGATRGEPRDTCIANSAAYWPAPDRAGRPSGRGRLGNLHDRVSELLHSRQCPGAVPVHRTLRHLCACRSAGPDLGRDRSVRWPDVHYIALFRDVLE
jgi:hypothetical protein